MPGGRGGSKRLLSTVGRQGRHTWVIVLLNTFGFQASGSQIRLQACWHRRKLQWVIGAFIIRAVTGHRALSGAQSVCLAYLLGEPSSVGAATPAQAWLHLSRTARLR